MTTENKNLADFNEEDNEYTFNPRRESERDNSGASPTENNQDGKDPSPDGGGNNQDEPDTGKPFNEHPRWKEREDEWKKRFDDQEVRHQEELKNALDGIRQEFGGATKKDMSQTKPPIWFGGDQEQWEAYQADFNSRIAEAEENARKKAIEDISNRSSAEEKAIKEATDYMQQEVEFLTKDKTINPTGAKIDPNALVKYTVDNQLVDTKGKWNYRAAFKLMKAEGLIKDPKPNPAPSPERKALADATTKDASKGEPTTKTFKTSLDFKKPGAKPW